MLRPHKCQDTRARGLARDGFGEARPAGGDAALEEAAGSEELSVEQCGAGGATDQIVREQCEFDVEERTFADAADYGGHATAGVHVTSWLRAIFLVEDNDRISQGGGERSQLGIHFESAQGFADFVE